MPMIKNQKGLKLKSTKCCCGATKELPCLCMLLNPKGVFCSKKTPLCYCFKLLKRQKNNN